MAVRSSMNVSVTPENEQFVQRMVSSGRYHSASEVFREGLRLLERDEQKGLLEKWFMQGLTEEERNRISADTFELVRSEIRQKIQEGLEDIARGEVVDGESFFDRWKLRLSPAGDVGKVRNEPRRKA